MEVKFSGGGCKEPLYLQCVPSGICVRFDTYTSAPFKRELLEFDAISMDSAEDKLVFEEPIIQNCSIKRRRHSNSCVGSNLTHGQERTSAACQGKALSGGVEIVCGRREEANFKRMTTLGPFPYTC